MADIWRRAGVATGLALAMVLQLDAQQTYNAIGSGGPSWWLPANDGSYSRHHDFWYESAVEALHVGVTRRRVLVDQPRSAASSNARSVVPQAANAVGVALLARAVLADLVGTCDPDRVDVLDVGPVVDPIRVSLSSEEQAQLPRFAENADQCDAFRHGELKRVAPIRPVIVPTRVESTTYPCSTVQSRAVQRHGKSESTPADAARIAAWPRDRRSRIQLERWAFGLRFTNASYNQGQ